MRGRTVVTLIALTCGAAASSASAAELFGVASFAPFTPQSLYRINAATGATTLVGTTGVAEISGIAWNDAAGVLYAYTTRADLYTLDLATGAATLVASPAGIMPEGDITFGAAGSMLVTDGVSLAGLDSGTGAVSPIGSVGPGADDISGLAFDSAGRLLGFAKNGTLPDSIVELNPATGAATLVGLTGFDSASPVGGLTRDLTTGALLLTDGGSLFSVDGATGAATLIGAHGVGGFSGIASVPAPGAGALLAGGLLLAGRRRR